MKKSKGKRLQKLLIPLVVISAAIIVAARGYICIDGAYTYFDTASRSVNQLKELMGWDK